MLTQAELAIIISLISLGVAITSVLIKYSGLSLQKHSGRTQHMISDLDVTAEKLRKMVESSPTVKHFANDALDRALREDFKNKGISVPEGKPRGEVENRFISSVTELHQECQDYSQIFLNLKEKGFFNRILIIDSSLAWELLNTSYKTEAFLNLRLIDRLSKKDSTVLSDPGTLVTTMDIAGQILDTSRLCAQKLEKFLDIRR
ncbi:hypothetical protein MUP01_02165 [Candidatus Bathyarchaeota archaeon]|nr:hypothetical protein [Candidatus Bathyarchaeota archaeon]